MPRIFSDQPWRLSPAELAEGEPDHGGRQFLSAVEEWGRSEPVAKWRTAHAAVATGAALERALEGLQKAIAADFVGSVERRTTPAELARELARLERAGLVSSLPPLIRRGHPGTLRIPKGRRTAASSPLAMPPAATQSARPLLIVRRDEAEVAARNAAIEDFKTRWPAEFWCFGLPAHEFTPQRRVWIPAGLRSALSFEGARATADGKVYEDVLFYRAADHSGAADAAASPFGAAAREVPGISPVPRRRDVRDKGPDMIAGLEKALATGLLAKNQHVQLKAAWRAMLVALEHKGKTPPRGMGEDAFARHCRDWLGEKGIYP